MEIRKLIYPKRLTFIGNIVCDVCGESSSSKSIHTLLNDPTLGWHSCEQQDCIDIIEEWYKASTISSEDLQDCFGPSVKIQRTSGKMQNDWEISGDAYTVGDDYWWVIVKKIGRSSSKCVLLEHLENWNGKKYFKHN